MGDDGSMKPYLNILAILAVALAGCSDKPVAGVDTVFFNATVYTVDSEQAWAEAIAVDGDSIVYVGDSESALALAGDSTKRVDLDGKLVLPGFIDAHFHPLNGGAYVNALSLNTYGTPDEWVAAIAEYAEQRPEQEILFGYGFLATTFGPAGPTRQQIDAVVADRPVLIVDEGFHGGWANSAALELLNITQDTPDPEPGFSYYKRDASGDATGYLLEGTAMLAMDALDVIGDDIVVAGTGDVIDIMNGYGITAGFDAGGKLMADHTKNLLDRVAAAGELTLRLKGSVRARKEDSAETTIARAVRRKSAVIGDNYHYDTLKIPNDGTVESRTAAMFEDYQGEPGNSGMTVFTEEELTELISAAAAQNIDVHVHSLGERAIHETLNSIETTRAQIPDSQSRYAITHIQAITDQDVPRFGELDVIGQTTPLWASYDTYGEQFVSDDQFQRFWRFKSIEDTDGMLTFGSDYPATGAGTLGLSPLVQIEIGHTRQWAGQSEGEVQPLESERLSIASLIRGYTLDAAYQLRMEDEIGSIEVGKKADIVVLEDNIFEIDPYAIHSTRILQTYLGGEVVFAAE
ncbi:MAG: amidohydrolase [Woeseiaceae bacterium]